MISREEGTLGHGICPTRWLEETQQEKSIEKISSVAATQGGMLGDDPGLGKTLQCISLMVYRVLKHPEDTPYKSSMVLAPAQLVLNWVEEIQRFAPDPSERSVNTAKDNDVDEKPVSFPRFVDLILPIGSAEIYDLVRSLQRMFRIAMIFLLYI